MTKPKRKPIKRTKTKPDDSSPCSTSSSPPSISEEKSPPPPVSSSTSSNMFKTDGKKEMKIKPEMKTPQQYIKKEMGMMKLNGHFNDLEKCFSENSILFGKEINSTASRRGKRSIVTFLQEQEEDFKNRHYFKQQSDSSSSSSNIITTNFSKPLPPGSLQLLSMNEIVTGSKKRKQTRPVQAPVPSQCNTSGNGTMVWY